MNADCTCPFCNARQSVALGATVGHRQTCSRCGESFRVAELLPTTTAEAVVAPQPYRKPVGANRVVAGVVLCVMLVMAGTGLTYALLTVQQRRDHDKALPRKARRPWLQDRTVTDPGDAVHPADLPALGYLPPNTGMIAAVQVPELLSSPWGKEWRSKTLKIANGDFSLDSVRDWTGLAVEDIDHAVLGVVVRAGDDADLTPPVHLVVRTRRPYNPALVRLALKATTAREERTPDGGKRTVYSATARNVPLHLWLATEDTLVLGLFSKLEQVPATPLEGVAHLPAEVREGIDKRLVAGTPAWAVGHAADWKKTWLPTLAGNVKDLPLLSKLEDMRTFAVYLTASKPAKLAGAFRCSSEAVAKKLEETDLAAQRKASPETFKSSREADWLDVQVTLGQGK